jgi:hypothetical protein
LATVVAVNSIAIRSSDMPNVEIEYEYRAGHSIYRGKDKTILADNSPREGDTLIVTYLPSDPHRHIVRKP